MGQKVHPIGFRLGIIKNWQSNWFAQKDYAEFLHEDLVIRNHIKSQLYHAGISSVQIERKAKQVKINIYTARPGIIIGKKGHEVDRLKEEIQKMLDSKQVYLNIKEIRRPETDPQLIAETIAYQLERRVTFRRAMKKSVATVMKFGAKGIRINCDGRLAGAEIARMEWYREGRVPLHTLRADVTYGFAEAHTTYGLIGVKVWIFQGEVLSQKEERKLAEQKTLQDQMEAEKAERAELALEQTEGPAGEEIAAPASAGGPDPEVDDPGED
jgi:small subunit ribosomal protein S3